MMHRYCQTIHSAVAIALVSYSVPVTALAQTPSSIDFKANSPAVDVTSQRDNPNQENQVPTVETVPGEYFIGPGDQLQVTVFGYAEYTGTQVVLSDGTISLPLIGSVKAVNKTPSALAQSLTTALNQYLVNPTVTVSITNIRPITVNVAGEVQRPGPVQLRSVTAVANTASVTNAGLLSLQAPTLVAALLEAGGVGRDADIRRVVVKRANPTGDATPITLNLWNSLVSENAAPNVILQDGDSVFVPKIPAGETLERRLIAKSILAPKTIRVRVVGEVKKPGELEVPPTSSISGAISIAGGPTDKANLRKVAFVRLADDGRVEKQILNLKNLMDTNQVQDGDVIYVPKGGGWRALDIASPLLSPLSFLLNLLQIP